MSFSPDALIQLHTYCKEKDAAITMSFDISNVTIVILVKGYAITFSLPELNLNLVNYMNGLLKGCFEKLETRESPFDGDTSKSSARVPDTDLVIVITKLDDFQLNQPLSKIPKPE